MKKYRATIQADKYPLDFTVTASTWPAAVARSVRAWMKKRPHSRTDTLTIKIVKIGDA